MSILSILSKPDLIGLGTYNGEVFNFGAFLSGGIDSSASVALMRRATNGTIKTFSVYFNESETSEGERRWSVVGSSLSVDVAIPCWRKKVRVS